MFGLNKLADKDFIIGFVLPVLIAILAFGLLFHDQLSFADTNAIFSDQKSFASLTVVVLSVWTVAIILMTINRYLYRMLEGYFGPFSLECWRRRMRKKREEWKQKNLELYRAGGLEKVGDGSSNQNYTRQLYASSQAKFLDAFPQESLIMPTRFGNVIRSFENYPNDVYKFDGIGGWPRLVSVLPSTYVSAINDARAEVDFWVNCCGLAAFFTVAVIVRLIFNIARFGITGSLLYFLVCAFFAIIVSFLSYNCAVERAANWGNFVKAAFDLYLPALAKQLGYKLPKARSGQDSQDQFWDAFSATILTRAPFLSENWEVVASEKAADAKSGEEASTSFEAQDSEPSSNDEEDEPAPIANETVKSGTNREANGARGTDDRANESPIISI